MTDENLEDLQYKINCIECNTEIIKSKKCHITVIVNRGGKCNECYYKRNCPSCNKIINYTYSSGFYRAEAKNSLCAGCVKIGNDWTWNKNKKLPEHIRQKVAVAGTKTLMEKVNNKPRSLETREKLSKANKGKKLSTEHRRKIRIGVLKAKQNHIKLYPNYTKEACKLFDEINTELGWNGQHAENGKEFHIKELGYWVDYYEPNLNLVIEYDDKGHKYRQQKDKLRQEEIEQYLGCKFYRIKEGQDWKQIILNT
jgi:hypothetical protein